MILPDNMRYEQNIYVTEYKNRDLDFIESGLNTPWNMYRDGTNFKGICLQIGFMPGKHDNWAAVVLKWKGKNEVLISYPKDAYYFSKLGLFALKYGKERLYKDIEILYNLTEDFIDKKVINYIDVITSYYGEDSDLLYNLFLHVYYGMVAEEHYQRINKYNKVILTSVGKLVKMVGIAGFLKDNKDISFVCTESCNMPPNDIKKLAEKYGIKRNITWTPYSTIYDDVKNHPVINF